MKASSYRFRIATFAVVVLVMGGLITTLLQEARAIEVVFVSPSTSFTGGTAQFTVDVKVPRDQRIPIQHVEVIIERQASDQSGTGVSGKFHATVAARVRCAMSTTPSYNCPDNNALSVQAGSSGIVTKIAFGGAFLNDASVSTNRIDDSGYGYFQEGPLRGSKTGYGYDTTSPLVTAGLGGYGYGYQDGDVSTIETGTTGFGYGYDGSGTLVLRFTIDVSTGNVGTGVRYITLQMITGSAVLGDFSSPFHAFSISGGGGGGGGGDGTATTTPTTGTGADQTQKVTATAIAAPDGALFASKATVATASAGNKIEVTTGDSVMPTITITMATAVTNMDITFVRWPATATAEQLGTGAIPSGISTAYFFTITLSTGSASSASMVLKIPQASVTANPERAILLRYVAPAWNPEAKIALSLVGTTYEATVTTACCSVFAVAFDETPPTVDFAPPTGTQTGTVELTADATDNIQVTRVVWFDGTTQIGEDTSAPYQLSLNTATLTNGDHTLKAVAHDFAGNTAEESGTMTVQNEEATETEEAKPKAINTLIIIIIVIVVILLVVGAFVLAGKKPPAKKP